MSDQQPDPTRVEAGGTEPPTAGAPVRWSGSAAVPPPAPKKSRWPRRTAAPSGGDDDNDDRTTIPAQDPWAEYDTPIDPLTLPPPPEPTRIEEPTPVPPPAPVPLPVPAAPPPAAPVPDARRMPPEAPKRWRQKHKPQVNRVPVQARPAPPPRYVAPPPDRRPLPPPRRKRRWPRNLLVLSLLGLVCCCGVPGYFVWPAAGQYPVTAALPDSVSDLNLRDDRASRRAADALSAELNDASAFAGVYSDGNGKRVTIFGVTGLRLTPEQDVQAQMDHLSAEYALKDVQPYDLGVTGLHERCGVGRRDGSALVVCAWADHGSLATVLLTRRNVPDSAELTGVLRSAVLQRG